MTIYNLTNDHLYLLSLLEDPESDPDVIRDTLEASLGNIEAEAENLIVVTKEIESDIDKFDKEIDRLTKQKKYMENSTQARMMSTDMVLLSMTHLRRGCAGYNEKGKARSFMILKPEPDMKAIRTALEEGFELDFAHLEPRGVHLNVR